MSQTGSMNRTQQGADIVSPFRLPNEEEVFIFRETEKQKKQEIKKKNKNLHIWDKKTASCRNPKRLFRNFIDEDEIRESIDRKPNGKFNQKQKALINEALEIIRQRQKVKETVKTKKGLAPKKKEGIVELIEQKKEMFLVEKTCNIINQEIFNLDKKREARRQALESSKKLMKEDEQGFEKFLDENKRQTQEAITQAENMLNNRKRLENRIKVLKQQQNAIASESQRIDEAETNYKVYKKFLDDIKTSDSQYEDWAKQKQQKKDILIKKELRIFIQREKQKIKAQKDQMKAYQKSRAGHIHTKKHYKTEDEMKSSFLQLFKEGKVEAIEEFEDTYPMYFDKEDKLIKIFQQLESQNLDKIKETQDTQYLKDQLNKEFRLLEKELTKEIKINEVEKQIWKKKIESEQKQINQLKRKLQRWAPEVVSQKTKKKGHKGLSFAQKKQKTHLRVKIEELYKRFFEIILGLSKINDKDVKELERRNKEFVLLVEKMQTIDILSSIESYLDEVLLELKMNEMADIQYCKENQLEKTKAEKMKQKQTLQKKEDELKILRQQEKTLKPTQKRHGRIAMTKSRPIQKKYIEKKTEDMDDEKKRIQKYFQQGYQLMQQ